MMTDERAIYLLKGILPKKVSYAQMICASNCYGDEMVYQDPEPYAIEYAIGSILENNKLKAGIEQLKSNNDKMHHDLKLSVNAQSLVNRLLQEMFSAECYNDEFNGQEVTNLLCLGNVCDVLEEMCNYER